MSNKYIVNLKNIKLKKNPFAQWVAEHWHFERTFIHTDSPPQKGT